MVVTIAKILSVIVYLLVGGVLYKLIEHYLRDEVCDSPHMVVFVLAWPLFVVLVVVTAIVGTVVGIYLRIVNIISGWIKKRIK